MASDGSCLGICYAGHHLFYSVNNPEKDGYLQHLGSFDFNFDIQHAIITGDARKFPAVKNTLEGLKKEFGCSVVRILSPAAEECWTIVPRYVYEDEAEREAHIRLFMHGSNRNDIETVCHSVSNADYRLLLLRNSSAMQGFQDLLGAFSHSEYVAEFEIGSDWQVHSNVNGSFLMIHCQRSYLSISSFILGKLRGCTFIQYDQPADLPYLWNLYASQISWMQGIHENIYIFGHNSRNLVDTLLPFWDQSGEVQIMNTLDSMHVSADEKTYGFPLESAFPAVLMSLNKDLQAVG